MEPEEISDQLTLSPEQAFYIIVKAREFDEQVEPTDPDSGSNPADDREVDVLEEEEEIPSGKSSRRHLRSSTSTSSSICSR
jgi:hypothetical protein